MAERRNAYDVTNAVNTTDPAEVRAEIGRIFSERYPTSSMSALSRAFADCTRMYRGRHPGYRACDTAYHNLQHTLDVALAMARLMDGYERAPDAGRPLGARLFSFGIVTALFHDIGYLRTRHDTRHQNGAEYTMRHVSRGARVLEGYLRELGMADLAASAGRLVHFTGYEVPVEEIEIADPTLRRLGYMLGSADIMAQMADRCYLEKCHDRLYPEFVFGGLAARPAGPTPPTARFTSPDDLLRKTPQFYALAMHRLNTMLGGAHEYAARHFGGENLYLTEVEKNIRHAERLATEQDVRAMLRRTPPALERDPESELAAAAA
jgi:hypothetical protein